MLCAALVVLAAQLLAVVSSLGESDFITPQPTEWIKGEGGKVEVFSRDFKFLQDADLSAAMITVETESMALPAYHDTPVLSYVLSGRARAGLISPLGFTTQLRDIEVGDVVAIPKGWTIWMWNAGNQEPLRMIAIGQTARGMETSHLNTFRLMGAQGKHGGAIQGFSDELLSRAWNVNPKEVKALLEAQTEVGFVKVGGKGVRLPETAANHHAGLGEYVYNILRASPEVLVKNGGSLTLLNMFKFPALRQLDLSMCRLSLKKGATFAPHFVNAARVMHVLRGSARLEITHNDGKEALRARVQAGDTIVVPPMLPLAMFTEEEELEMISFGSKAAEVPSFLAGYNSLYHAIPKQVLLHGFNVDEETLEKFYSTRRGRNEVAIFAPSSQQSIMDTIADEFLKHTEGVRTRMEEFYGEMQNQLLQGQGIFAY